MKKYIKKLFFMGTDNVFVQVIRYGFVGGIAAVVNVGGFYLFMEFLGLHYILSSVLSFLLGLATNYLLSIRYVFGKERAHSRKVEIFAHTAISVIALFLDTLLLFLFTQKAALPPMVGKILSTGIVFVWNFTARKIFHQHQTNKEINK